MLLLVGLLVWETESYPGSVITVSKEPGAGDVFNNGWRNDEYMVILTGK